MGDRWTTTMVPRDPREPSIHHPADGKNSLVYVSRHAKLTLMFQAEFNWQSTTVDLQGSESVAERLTHASICEQGDRMLLVTYDEGKRVRLYRVSIAWNATQHPRPGGMPATVVAPVIKVSHLTTLDDVVAQQAEMAKLTYLHLIPATPTAASPGVTTEPIVLAVFTHSALQADPTQQHPDALSVICRWSIEPMLPVIHDGFSKLKINGKVPTQPYVSTLQKQADIVTPKIILSVESKYHHTCLLFIASDGSIDFRQRTTMSTIEASFDAATVSSLSQSGFEQPAFIGEHATHIVPSPDDCAAIYCKSDDELSAKSMTFRYSWQMMDDGISNMRELIEAGVTCLARQYAILCTYGAYGACNDETLATIPTNLNSELRTLFVHQLFIMTNRALDFSMLESKHQQSFPYRDSIIPRIVSAQYIIGMKSGKTNERALSGRFAGAFLNLRFVSMVLAQMISRPDTPRPEVLNPLRGLVKWGTDFLIHVSNFVLPLTRSPRGQTSAKEVFEELIRNNDDPSVHLLLCTFTRVYLRILLSMIPKYLVLMERSVNLTASILERQQLSETVEYCVSLPFKYANFETLLLELDAAVRLGHTQSGVSDKRRSEIELQLLTTAINNNTDQPTRIPVEFSHALTSLLDFALPKFAATVDMGKLYFWNTTWLGLGGRKSEQIARTRYDALRKLPLPRGAKLRLCRRCGSRMEDITGEKVREFSPWLWSMHRNCICTSVWILE